MEGNIIIFDGICNLCNASINFLIKIDKNNVFKFVAMQSESGEQLLKKYGFSTTEIDSFLLISNKNLLTKSDAIVRISAQLPFPWNLFFVLKILPKGMRDYLYSLVAKNRYKWFGKKNQCLIPTPELNHKFLS